MKRYSEYKDSGIEWVGQVPKNWLIKRLKFVADINPSRLPGIADTTQCVFIPMEAMNSDGTFNQSLRKPVSELKTGFTCFAKDDVIFAKITPCFENGKGALLAELESDVGFGSTEFHVLRIRKGITIPRFLYYLSISGAFRRFGEAFMQGVAGQKRVTNNFVRDFVTGVPPVEAQGQITDFLDRKTAQIDALIAKKERMIELLKEECAAVINQAVTKGLDPTVELKDSGTDWLGKVPKHWQMKRLKYLVSLVNQPIEETTGTEFRIDLEDLESWTGETIEVESQNKNIEGMKSFVSGDVLFNKLRPYLAKVYRAKNFGVCGGELLVLRPTTLLDSDFLFYRVLSSAFINVVDGSTYGSKMPRASWDFIGDLIVPFPGKSEQTKIVEYLRQSLQRMDIILQKLTSEIEYLREYRTALISEVVTGKIDVRDGK